MHASRYRAYALTNTHSNIIPIISNTLQPERSKPWYVIHSERGWTFFVFYWTFSFIQSRAHWFHLWPVFFAHHFDGYFCIFSDKIAITSKKNIRCSITFTIFSFNSGFSSKKQSVLPVWRKMQWLLVCTRMHIWYHNIVYLNHRSIFI